MIDGETVTDDRVLPAVWFGGINKAYTNHTAGPDRKLLSDYSNLDVEPYRT